MPAAVADLDMPAQRRRAASRQGLQDVMFGQRHRCAAGAQVLRPMPSNDVGHFEVWPIVHGRLPVTHLARQHVQRAGGGSYVGIGDVRVQRGCFKPLMSQQLLDREQIGACLQVMGGEAVP